MDQTINQTDLAESVSGNIPYEFVRNFLVKPLEIEKVKKEFSKPINTTTTNEDGLEVENYESVEKIVEEVDSDYRKGIVLKVPFEYESMMKLPENGPIPIKVGDTVFYRTSAGRYFDLCKDTQLIAIYDVIGVCA